MFPVPPPLPPIVSAQTSFLSLQFWPPPPHPARLGQTDHRGRTSPSMWGSGPEQSRHGVENWTREMRSQSPGYSRVLLSIPLQHVYTMSTDICTHPVGGSAMRNDILPPRLPPSLLSPCPCPCAQVSEALSHLASLTLTLVYFLDLPLIVSSVSFISSLSLSQPQEQGKDNLQIHLFCLSPCFTLCY